MSVSGGLTELIRDLDHGPAVCQLDRVLKWYSPDEVKSERMLIMLFLGYADSDVSMDLAARLYVLIEKFHSISQTNKAIITSLSVARWIYLTNKIEFESVDSESDTFKLMMLVEKQHSTTKGIEKEEQEEKLDPNILHHKYAPNIQRTFELLKNTYKPEHYQHKAPESCLTFDKDKLLQWMTTLFPNNVHNYRQHGSCPSGSNHVYPHHTSIPQSMENLMRMIYKIFRAIPVFYTSQTYRILYTFALAAFAQFHFVDIHPFEDGNGRMCRFISKHILGWVCPVPFMFSDREEYINALINGSKLSSFNTPSLLLNVLLTCAVEHYEEMIRHRCAFDHLFVATSELDLESQLKTHKNQFTSRDIEEILKKFKTVEKQSMGTIQINNETIALKRDDCLEFDKI